MPEIISDALPRIKFTVDCRGKIAALSHSIQKKLQKLSSLQDALEKAGAIPILDDGLVAGNCGLAALDEKDTILVSRSGKSPGVRLTIDDFVQVEDFDRTLWKASFRTSSLETMRPTSDTPMYMAALRQENKETFGWSARPKVALHGHALANEEKELQAAQHAGMPISMTETLFSTPEDLDALEKLFTEFPFPKYKCYIRKGHGFLLLAEDLEEAKHLWENYVLPAIEDSRNPD